MSRSSRNDLPEPSPVRWKGAGRLHVRIVIPTRNRADLAAAAARSLLELDDPALDVLISDNSTDPAERDALEEAAAELGVARILPPAPMAMAEHWESAIRQALADPTVTHVGVVTDRTLVTPALRRVLDLAGRYPDDVITYGHDVLDDRDPARLEQVAWTGRVLRIESVALLELAARSRHWLLEPVVPRLLNSVVPRHVIGGVMQEFAAAAGLATSPDYAFAFRCLVSVASIIHYDRPVVLPYALDRSNGTSTVAGVAGGDQADFMAALDGALLPDAPIPGLLSAASAVANEYNAVRRVRPELEPIEVDDFLDALAGDAAAMQPGAVRDRLEAALRAHGRDPQPPPADVVVGPRWFERPGIRKAWRVLGPRFEHAPPDRRPRFTPVADRTSGLVIASRSPRLRYPGRSSLEVALRDELGKAGARRLRMPPAARPLG